MLIYNLYPRLFGKIENWPNEFSRIKAMGFDTIYINPFYVLGKSRSLYSIKDHRYIDPEFLSPQISQEDQLKHLICEANKYNLKIILDLVINHTAIDAVLTKTNKHWYKLDNHGKVKCAGCEDVNTKQWVSWHDLAHLDWGNKKNISGLIKYWQKVIFYYLDLGFAGFRCDAAYQIPVSIWKYLIKETKKKYPKAVFLAETLGCHPKYNKLLFSAGFDYNFNSAKWWDYQQPWLITQYNQTAKYGPSISFPESHDTDRLFAEFNNNLEKIKAHLAFTAFFAEGFMITAGLEYGITKKIDVSKTNKHDWQKQKNISKYIQYLNSLIKNRNKRGFYKVFYQNQNLLIMQKNIYNSLNKTWLVINKRAENIKLPNFTFKFFTQKLSNKKNKNRSYLLPNEVAIYYLW